LLPGHLPGAGAEGGVGPGRGAGRLAVLGGLPHNVGGSDGQRPAAVAREAGRRLAAPRGAAGAGAGLATVAGPRTEPLAGEVPGGDCRLRPGGPTPQGGCAKPGPVRRDNLQSAGARAMSPGETTLAVRSVA